MEDLKQTLESKEGTWMGKTGEEQNGLCQFIAECHLHS